MGGVIIDSKAEPASLSTRNGIAEPLIQITNLSVSFTARGSAPKGGRAIKALDKVSLEVFSSEVLCVVGESGSGKTTLARCITGITRPNSGSIRHDGAEVTRLGGRKMLNYRRDVQMIFQDPFESLNPRETIFTAVSTPIRLLAGEGDATRLKESVRRVLEEVGLDSEKVMNRFPHQLSGGERQRVNIARALAPSPKILIADEPVTMVDASQRLEILSLLHDLKSMRNLSIVLITHDLASASVMADRIAVMYLGRVVEMGPVERVFSKPSHPYTELILRATPSLATPLEPLSSDDHDLGASDIATAGCSFRPRCRYATQVCAEQEPNLESKSENQLAACHNALNIGN